MVRYSKKKRATIKKKPDSNPNLEGFDIRINSFGEIYSTYDIDSINEFLNKNLKDKKMKSKQKGKTKRS